MKKCNIVLGWYFRFQEDKIVTEVRMTIEEKDRELMKMDVARRLGYRYDTTDVANMTEEDFEAYKELNKDYIIDFRYFDVSC